MSSKDFGALWTLMSKYTFEMESESLNEDLLCVICNKIVIDAHQSICGCNYCHKCINEYLSGESKYCPGKKEDCKKEQIVLGVNLNKNSVINKKVFKAKVKCPNELCQSSEELIKMEDHLRTCIKQKIECPYVFMGCDNKGGAKGRVLDHIHNDIWQHTFLLIDYIQNMKNEDGRMKEDLEMCKLEIASLKEDSREKEVRIKEMLEEMTKMKKEFEDEKKLSKTIKDEVKTLKTESTKYKEETQSKFNTLKEESDKREDSRETKMSVNKFVEESKLRVDSLKETIERMDVWTEEQRRVGGEALFSVDRFSVRKASGGAILSPYFYSHTNGYKLRLRVSPGGEYDGKGTHLSVYSVICKGEYDDELSWPCKHSFKISVVNQSKGGDHTGETWSHSSAEDKLKHCFNKPIDKDNLGLGCPLFIAHSALSVAGLSVNDVVVIKCTVGAPP